MRRRTRAREIAVQFLYQLDVRGEEALASLTEFLHEQTSDERTRAFARERILGAHRMRSTADQLLRSVARNWNLERMAVVDRNVLRLALYEMLSCPDIPAKVVINEAIELGKKFSTANSGAFINGILDRVRQDREAQAREQQAREQEGPEPQNPEPQSYEQRAEQPVGHSA